MITPTPPPVGAFSVPSPPARHDDEIGHCKTHSTLGPKRDILDSAFCRNPLSFPRFSRLRRASSKEYPPVRPAASNSLSPLWQNGLHFPYFLNFFFHKYKNFRGLQICVKHISISRNLTNLTTGVNSAFPPSKRSRFFNNSLISAAARH